MKVALALNTPASLSARSPRAGLKRAGATVSTKRARPAAARRMGIPPTRASAAAAVAAVAMVATAGAASSFGFTPAASLLGGLSLGVLASSKLALTGRILGISGIVGGVAKGSTQAWRLAFVVGLVAGGFALQLLLPSALETLPAAYTLQRAVAAGLLVGVGTSMGSGCTSGHGICGNARLSLRSLVATVTFMTSGAVAAYLTSTAAVFSLSHGVAPLLGAPMASPAARLGVWVLVIATLAMAGLAVTAWAVEGQAGSPAALQKELMGAEELEDSSLIAPPPPEPLDAQKLASVGTFAELLVGFLFALGLGVSGMTQPSKVTAFLAVMSGTFDASLMFVMGGALLVALPSFQWMLRFKGMPRPTCAPCFDLPTKTAIDVKLVLGALLFGAGWGIGGVCPGPGLVNLASLQSKSLAFVAAMLVGMRFEAPLTTALLGKGS